MKGRRHTAILSRIATLTGGVLLGSLVYTTTAFALDPPLIMEVQPYLDESPPVVVIYGRNFGDDPKFTFGTGRIGDYNGYLTKALDQSKCPMPVDGLMPPLDDTIPGYSCWVGDLPEGDLLPSGDYLIEIWVEGPLECTEKPSSLTFDYLPGPCSSSNAQGEMCFGDDLTGVVVDGTYTAGGHNNAEWSPSGGTFYAVGGTIVFTGTDKWPNEMTLHIQVGDLMQDIQFHTSCSQPLAELDEFASFTLVDFFGAKDAFTQHDEYDLTIGAVGPEGPQGEQGKLGPQGEQGKVGAQGEQGKIGPEGAQGEQGKIGPEGAQGEQGKIGPEGAQGEQGKIGPEGAQGEQGKIGPEGAQGEQGKIGPEGAQGEQGKLGPQGEQGKVGAQGEQGKLGPQGEQGKVGAQGEQGKLGPQGEQGKVGAQGEQGKLGPQGEQGKVGATG